MVKKIASEIEIFGDFHHGKKRTGRTKEEEEQRKIKHFTQYGYQTLIIWQHELQDLKSVQQKILKFDKC